MTPIRPENLARYPESWLEIRAKIQERAGDRCEGCGVKNYAVGYWSGERFIVSPAPTMEGPYECRKQKLVKIVCTTAHLDHTPENCDPDNLRFWCQRCHNRYDAPHRAAGIKERRRTAQAEAGQEDLFDEKK